MMMNIYIYIYIYTYKYIYAHTQAHTLINIMRFIFIGKFVNSMEY